mmetsp:Transcript_26285/g.71094  ORF Transcript_26285/g.71094 Transcript_26285/m.71094 type:complete len:112 (-) Transcript_26285:1688-2023(-)
MKDGSKANITANPHPPANNLGCAPQVKPKKHGTQSTLQVWVHAVQGHAQFESSRMLAMVFLASCEEHSSPSSLAKYVSNNFLPRMDLLSMAKRREGMCRLAATSSASHSAR